MDTRYNRGARIAALRKERGLTQEALAKKVGATKAAVSKWENSAAADIGLEAFFNLARVLDIDPTELATNERPKVASLPRRRIALIEAYGTLSDDVRARIRALIETLAQTQSDGYQRWSAEQAKRAALRDKKKTEPEQP